jgi:hypothetical protein
MQLVRHFGHFMETDGSQKYGTGFYPKPVESTLSILKLSSHINPNLASHLFLSSSVTKRLY